MLDSQFTARVASVTSFVLFGTLMFSHSRDRAAIMKERAVQDSMAAELRRNAAVEATLLHAGDYLPDVQVRTASGASFSLRTLARTGAKYIYVYRKDCPPCQLLDTVLAQVPATRRDSIAYIAFIKDSTLPAEPLPRHYAWVVDSSTRNKYFRRVPSLVVVDTSGRVVAEAQESLPRVAGLFDLYVMIRRSDVESLVARAQRRLIASAGTDDAGATQAVVPNAVPLQQRK